MPSVAVVAECDTGSIMSVPVPVVSIVEQRRFEGLPYAYAEITGEADYSVERAAALIPKMVKLAEVEKTALRVGMQTDPEMAALVKTARLLAAEIERNKRRVNALEYVMIPQLEETIKYIKSKLDENERAAVIRLMKVKSKA